MEQCGGARHEFRKCSFIPLRISFAIIEEIIYKGWKIIKEKTDPPTPSPCLLTLLYFLLSST
jgi:hypothetical protein